MREILQLRINSEFANLLFNESEGKKLGSVSLFEIDSSDLRLKYVPEIINRIKNENNSTFLFGWNYTRKFTVNELKEAKLFQIIIKKTFDPTGEECGTKFDNSSACNVCGAGRLQLGHLFLNKKSIPKKDISKTIGGEIIISSKLKELLLVRGQTNEVFKPIYERGEQIKGFYQLNINKRIKMSSKIITGINPFNLSNKSNNEIYKCPNNDTLGLNLLSPAYVEAKSEISRDVNIFRSEQYFGVSRGLLRPQPIYLCTPLFRDLILDEKLTGFEFEIAYFE